MTEAIDQRINAANRRVNEIERARNAEIEAATSAINGKYAEALSAAKRELVDAKQAELDHIDATSAHPWDGKRVYLERPKYASAWSRTQIGVERLEGVLEVVRQTSEFPSNMTYSRPRLGTVIIRKLKKDGTPSLTLHNILGAKPETAGWKLAE